jgi:phosphoenolpyruvate carboxylase
MTHAANSLTIDPTFRLQKHVAKLESERTEEIGRLKTELAKLRKENQEAITTIYEHNLVLKNLNEKIKQQNVEREQQQAERDKQFHEAYGKLVRDSQDMIRELLDEKTEDIASKCNLDANVLRKTIKQKAEQKLRHKQLN